MPFPLPPGLPPEPGLGFKPQHYAAIRDARAPVGFFEIHAENYMGAGGPDPLDCDHLARLRVLCDRYEPGSFSEHLAWSSHDGAYLDDLLPLPYIIACRSTAIARARRSPRKRRLYCAPLHNHGVTSSAAFRTPSRTRAA
jgi:uncharacterized protein